MAKKDVIPNLEKALESGFSELKAGEENIKIEKPKIEQNNQEQVDYSYGLKINAKEERTKFISKPIKATKKIVEKPIEVKQKEPKQKVEEVTKKNEVVGEPSSKIGDDFDVSW